MTVSSESEIASSRTWRLGRREPRSARTGAPQSLDELNVPERVNLQRAYGRDIYQASQVNVLLGRFVRIRGDLLMAAPGVLDEDDRTKVTAAVVCSDLLREARDLLERRKVPLTVVTHQLSLADRALVSLYSDSVMRFRVQTLETELHEVDPESDEQLSNLDQAKNGLRDGNRQQVETAVKDVLSHIGEMDERQLIADDLQVSRLSKAIGVRRPGLVPAAAHRAVRLQRPAGRGGADHLAAVDLDSAGRLDLFLGGLGLSLVGAVGGIVSGMFSVRDSATSLLDYRTSVKRMALKPLFGAVAALTLYFFLSANLISGVAVTSAGTYVVAAFLAGFSERYFLRIVDPEGKDKVAANGEQGPRQRRTARRPRPPPGSTWSGASSGAQCRPFQESHSAAYEPPAATSSSWEPNSEITPSSTTATRSASWAEKRRWAIAITVRPWSTAASDRSRWRAARGSISEVASSRTSVCGSASTSRASAICCAWAAVRARPPEPTTVSRPSGRASTQSRASTASRAARISSSPAPGGAARARFSRSVPTKTWCSWVTSATWPRRSSSGSSTRPDAADGDRAGARRVDAGQQPAEGRLAGTRRADHGDPLAHADVEVDAVQHVAPLDVREADVVGLELLVLRLGAGDLAVVGHLRRRRAAARATRRPSAARRGC